MKRRAFLHATSLVPVLPLAAGLPFRAVLAGTDSRRTPIPLYKVVFDDRFAHSRALATRSRRLGVATAAIQGDVTDLWYHDLDLRWRNGPAAIAGMTTGDSLFCLERLAWDRGMRVVFRAEHRCLPAGHIEHAISGPVSLLRDAADLEDAGADWAGRIAHWVTNCPADGTRMAEATAMTAPVFAVAERVPLVSWVIA